MYETKLMTKAQMEAFTDFVDDKLGVDYDINETDDDEYYLFFMDLELDEEYEALRNFENAMDPPSYDIMKFQSKEVSVDSFNLPSGKLN
jgi:stress response protein YsnF